MERWDLYDKDRKILSKKVTRGETLCDNEYHLVINAWIKNKNNEFLITQRSENKSHPLMWECTGGSALAGETSKEAAIREIKEELGIEVDSSKGILIGSTRRYYKGCPDILDIWLFESDVSLEEIKIQEEEVCDYAWSSIEEIRNLLNQGKFEANAMFERVLNIVEKKQYYYIGFNANNAICNENFFDGSITLYPNREKGNHFYSSKRLEDRSSKKFMESYKEYIFKTAKDIQSKNSKSYFLCFNEKIIELCKDMRDINILNDVNSKIKFNLNNKFETRRLVKDIVPILDYIWLDKKQLNYSNLKEMLCCNEFVVQGNIGAGGDNTYHIKSESDISEINDKALKYCVSKYIKHIPLNMTVVISDYEIVYLPISAQLISLIDKKYKYVGADFIYSNTLNKKTINSLKKYSIDISNRVKEMGYRGVLGIDFILDKEGNIYFMELNPRFQASSFLISKYLEKYCNTNIAELHYLAISNKPLGNNYLENINSSFLNCNKLQSFDNYSDYEIINNGYFEENSSSYYRKIFHYSLINNADFEHFDD